MNLSERDAFAMAALPAVYSDLMQNDFESLDFDHVAKLAYLQADAMIRRRNEKQNSFIGWANRYESGEIGSIYTERDQVPVLPEVKEVVAIYVAPDYHSQDTTANGVDL